MLTDPNEWRYVPGDSINTRNRGSISKLAWSEGPSFLLEEESKWSKDIPWIVQMEEIRTTQEYQVNVETTERIIDWSAIEFDYKNIASLYKDHRKTISHFKSV